MRPSNSLISDNQTVNSGGFVSSVIYATDILRASVQIVVSSGTLTGTFRLQASNDRATGATPIQFQPTNWSTVGSVTTVVASLTIVTGANQVFLMPATEVGYNYLRVIYTGVAGQDVTGRCSIRVEAKAL